MKMLQHFICPLLLAVLATSACRTTSEIVTIGIAEDIQDAKLRKKTAHQRAASAMINAKGTPIQFFYAAYKGATSLRSSTKGSVGRSEVQAQYSERPGVGIAVMRRMVTPKEQAQLSSYRVREVTAEFTNDKLQTAYKKAYSKALRGLVEAFIELPEGELVEGRIMLGTLEHQIEGQTVKIRMEGRVDADSRRALTEEEKQKLTN